jgi:hypothetical protein
MIELFLYISSVMYLFIRNNFIKRLEYFLINNNNNNNKNKNKLRI